MNFIKKSGIALFLMLCVGLISHPHALLSRTPSNKAIEFSNQTFTYYLNIVDFALSFIEIPTNIVPMDSTTIDSAYFAGRATLYDSGNNAVGTCSASFLCIQDANGIYTDISNYISVDNGLIVSWFTPTNPVDLLIDSLINSMVTECMVTASTKILLNPFYGQTYNLIVSSSNGRIYFQFTRTGAIF